MTSRVSVTALMDRVAERWEPIFSRWLDDAPR